MPQCHTTKVRVSAPPRNIKMAEDVALMQRNLDLFFRVLRFVSATPISAAPMAPPVAPNDDLCSPLTFPAGPFAATGGGCGGGAAAAAAHGELPGSFAARGGNFSFDQHHQIHNNNSSGVSGKHDAVAASNANSAGTHDGAAEALPSSASTYATTTMSGASVSTERTGTSVSSMNRVTIPGAFQDALEEFRMAATNLPLDRAAVQERRMALRRGMLRYYGARDERKKVRRLFHHPPTAKAGGEGGPSKAAAAVAVPKMSAASRAAGPGGRRGGSGGDEGARPLAGTPKGTTTTATATSAGSSVKRRTTVTASGEGKSSSPSSPAAPRPKRIPPRQRGGSDAPPPAVVNPRPRVTSTTRIAVPTPKNSSGESSPLSSSARTAPQSACPRRLQKRGTASTTAAASAATTTTTTTTTTTATFSSLTTPRAEESQFTLSVSPSAGASIGTAPYASGSLSCTQHSLAASGGEAQSSFGQNVFSPAGDSVVVDVSATTPKGASRGSGGGGGGGGDARGRADRSPSLASIFGPPTPVCGARDDGGRGSAAAAGDASLCGDAAPTAAAPRAPPPLPPPIHIAAAAGPASARSATSDATTATADFCSSDEDDDDGAASPLSPVGDNCGADTAELSSVNNLRSMQEIIPGLYCGSYVPAMNRDFLASRGITHICCCVDVGRFPFPDDFMYMKVPVMDTKETTISTYFPRTFEFIENALIKQRGAVLVHCGAGISRAPTVTAAYLIRKLRLSSTAALALVQQRRPFASPNIGFRAQLRAYAESMKVSPPSTTAEAHLADESRRAALAAINTATATTEADASPQSLEDGHDEEISKAMKKRAAAVAATTATK